MEGEIDLVEKRRKMHCWSLSCCQRLRSLLAWRCWWLGGDDDNGEKVIVWQDDNYIRQLKHLTTAQWEEAVFKFTSPLVVLVHSRNKKVLSYVSLIASYLTFAIFSCSPCLSNCYTFRTFVWLVLCLKVSTLIILVSRSASPFFFF